MKRFLSLALVLVMLVSLFSGLQLPAQAASASYNKGVREEVCRSLSTAATKYYTGSYTYDQLSALSGSALRSKLRTLITSDRDTVGYDGLKTYFAYTDAYRGSSSKLQLFYCNGATTSAWDKAATWNREHMWPDSKGGSAMEGDLHAMRPTDPKTNSSRGNHPYGEVNGGSGVYANEKNGELLGGYYANNTFEPLDFAKGDCARTVLYDYVVTSSMSSVEIVFTDVETLLNWCALDPVDTYEMSRNDVAEEIQGCRNPFVDYPELAWLVLGKQIPSGLTTPSGGSTTSYSITVSSNNTAYGTVKLQGRTITATPATGCYAAGYTVLSGSATVTQEGNIFTVTPSSDCSIRINFAKKATVTVGFHGAAETMTTYAGEAIRLPSAQDEAPYTFVGWVENRVEKTAVKPSYRAAGASYTPTANIDFYALYSLTEGGSGGSGEWILVKDESKLSAGAQVVIAANEKGVTAGDVASSYLTSVPTDFSSDLETIVTVPEETVILTLSGSSGAWTLTDVQGRVLGASNKKEVGWGAGTLTWDISIEDGAASIYNTIQSYGRILYNTSAPRFTTYTSAVSSSMQLPQLYMLDGTAGTTYYTTEITSCAHQYEASTTEPTCTEPGSTTYVCELCGNSYREEIPALGHNYETELTEPGCTNGGFETHTCERCGDSYTDNETEALGHDWGEGTVTTEPTQTQDGVMIYVCTRCEESRTEAIPALGEEEDQPCDGGEACPGAHLTDMPAATDWAHAGIDYALEKKLFEGMSETTFEPQTAMTRAMLVTVLWRYEGKQEEGKNEFSDVAEDAWYAKAVAWAYHNGIVNGVGEGLFDPEAEITREQLATILYRFAKWKEQDTADQQELDDFPDAEQVSEYAVEALQWAVAKKLINGVEDHEVIYLQPQGQATRAQVAAILMRFIEGA